MGIALQSRRTRDRRELALTRACDGNDGSDGKNDTELVPDLYLVFGRQGEIHSERNFGAAGERND